MKSNKIQLLNAFSLNMINCENGESIIARFNEMPFEKVDELLFVDGKEIVSHIGHATTADILGRMLGVSIPAVRDNFLVDTKGEDIVIVCQYKGDRLQEGATSLPEGASFKFYELQIEINR